MKVAALLEDLQFLAQILQEQLRAEVPSGEYFQVKCAVKNDQLMILTQHPQGVAADTENIFAVLEEVLQSLPSLHEQGVELFLRIVGVKLPYAKHSLILKAKEVGGEGVGSREWGVGIWERGQGENLELDSPPPPLPPFPTPDAPWRVSTFPTPSQEEETFDPMADAPDLSFYTSSKPRRPIKAIVLGAVVVAITALSGGSYFLTRPCTMFECKEIQTAEELHRSFRQWVGSAKSEQELTKLEQQFLAASAALKTIPGWSPRSQEAEKLATSLSKRSETIDKVLKAFDAASSATQKSRTPANSIEELKSRQHLWRQAIAPLETISSDNELYGLVQPRLAIYRTKLQAVNQQLLAEDKWIKQITAATAVANTATNQETTAKSLQQLQKVQSSWQVAVNILLSIPKTSSAYPEAQKLLAEYKPKLVIARDRATKQLLAAKTYNQAVNAAQQAKRYEQQNQWQAAVTYWNQALSAAKQINSESLYYTQAQTLIEPYSTALKLTEEKLQTVSFLQAIRTDLEKTCSDGIRVCNFTIDERQIMVRITPEYEQMLNSSLTVANNGGDANTVANITNHLQTLQQALEAISDNANLPIMVFDAQGSQIHTHIPGG